MHLDAPASGTLLLTTGISAREWAKHFDSVSVCFSKGLGAPVGSALAGPKSLIAKARRTRKLFGGGMRQAGIIAAACIYAMDHNVRRLSDDHRNAQIIAQAIADTPGLTLEPPEASTS